MITLFCIIFFYIIYKQIKKTSKFGPNVLNILLVCILVKILLLVLYEMGIVGLVDAGSDTEGFKEKALFLYENIEFLNLLLFWEHQSTTGTYPVLIALIYKVFYPSHLIIVLLNFLLHNSVILYSAKINTYFHLSKRNNYIIILVVAFFPLILSYSIILLREMIIIYFVSLVTLNIVVYYKENKLISSFPYLLSLTALVTLLHPGMLIFAMFSLIVLNKKIFHTRNLIVIIISYISLSAAVSAGYGGGYLNFLINNPTIDSFEERIVNSRENSVFRYEKLYTQSFSYNLFVALPVDYVEFFFMPFPFPISNLVFYGIWRYPAGLLCTVIFLAFCRNYKKVNHFEIKIIILILLASLPFVLGSGDVVQAVRHKMKLFPVLILILTQILSKANEKWHR